MLTASCSRPAMKTNLIFCSSFIVEQDRFELSDGHATPFYTELKLSQFSTYLIGLFTNQPLWHCPQNSLIRFTTPRLTRINIKHYIKQVVYQKSSVSKHHLFFFPPRARRSPAESDFEPRFTEDFLYTMP